MDKKKKETPDKPKTSNIIIFSPQELEDLGILKNSKEAPTLDSKPSKKRIIQVIKQSINSNKLQPSTCSTSFLNPQAMKNNLMKKVKASVAASTSNENPEPQVRILNAEVSKPLLMKSGAICSKPKKAVPSIVKKFFKPAPSSFTGSERAGKSILNQNEKIKKIILSAVLSNSTQVTKLQPTVINKSLHISKENFENAKGEQEIVSLDSDTKESDGTKRIIVPKLNVKKSNNTESMETIKKLNTYSRSKEDAPMKQNLNDIIGNQEKLRTDSENKGVVYTTKKEIKVVSSKQVSLTKEQLKDLFKPKTGKDARPNYNSKLLSTASTSDEFNCDLIEVDKEAEEKLETRDSVVDLKVSPPSDNTFDFEDSDVIIIEDDSSKQLIKSNIDDHSTTQDDEENYIFINDTEFAKAKIDAHRDKNGTISVVVVVDEKEYDSLKKNNIRKAEGKISIPSTIRSDEQEIKKSPKTPKKKSDQVIDAKRPIIQTRLIPCLSSELRTYSSIKKSPKLEKMDAIDLGEQAQQPCEGEKETSSDILLKVPKKRGRPRKNPLEPPKTNKIISNKLGDTIQSSISEKTTMKNESMSETVSSPGDNASSHPGETPEKVPRKRGRPRKNPLDPPKLKKPKEDDINNSFNNSLDTTNLDVFSETDVSKSGRKRRKINYYDMENNFLDEFVESKRKSSFSDDDSKPLKIKKSRLSVDMLNKDPNTSTTFTKNEEVPMSEKNETRLDKETKDVLKKESSDDLKHEIINDIKSETPNEKKTANADENFTTTDDTTSTTNDALDVLKKESISDEEQETNTAVQDDNTSKKNKTKRYNWTGQTQKMMQSIFTAAMKARTSQSDPKDDHDMNDNNQQMPSVDQSPQVEKTPRPRGRTKKGTSHSKVVIDNDGNVKCNTCNTKVVNKEWQSHNRNVHYNMAWREGEPFLNVDDHAFVRRTLMPILQEDKSLVCNKCSKEFHAVNDFIVHTEDCLGIVKGDLVVCAICNEEIDKMKWMVHKKKRHNNLTWRVGDPPLDLNNQDLVVTILNALYKAKVPLYCYKCKDTKKSVVGFLSHQSQCGNDVESAKIECPLCGRRVLPVSMASHHKLVHEPKPDEIDEQIAKDYGSLLNKRQAAKKAMKMIDTISRAKVLTEFTKYYIESPIFKDEDFVLPLLNEELRNSNVIKCKFENCEYESSNWEETVEHLEECSNKPEQHFVCKKCFSIFLLEEEVRKHIQDVHKINLPEIKDYDVDNESSDGEDEDKYRQQLSKLRKIENLKLAKNINTRIKPRFLQRLPTRSQKCLFSSAFEYTLEFCNEHFTESVLFDRLRYLKTDWKLLDVEYLDDYWPKEEFSCNVAISQVPSYKNVLKDEHQFSRFELFEVSEEEDSVTIFCGGPITSMAWLPTPHILLHCSQVLAVAVAKDFESNYSTNMNYNESCLIQFWDFGVLKKKIKPTKPQLRFSLALNYGPIWHMEWCPSGCYDEKLFHNDRVQRMGLLAVAGSMPTVNIYSIPFVTEPDDSNLVFKAKPLIKLQLYKDYTKVKNKSFPTRISWSKASGHRYVAVGYTDGMVAIFDLETTSDLLKLTKNNGVDVLFPYKIIKAHMHYISVLSLIHLAGGCRYLLTGSFDRNICVWNLTNDTCSLLPRKKIVSDGTWLTNWIAYVTTTDESNSTSANVNSGLSSYRNYMYDLVNIISSPTTFTSVSSSDWLNGLIQCTTSGEVLVIFPGQMQYNVDNDKRLKELRWMLGYTKLAYLSKSPSERVKEDADEKEDMKPQKKTKGFDPDTAAYIFNQSSRSKKYQPLTYEKAANKYGLVICDIKRKNFEEKSKNNLLDILEQSRPDLYPMQAINKVAFNPNCQASLYFATGYQVGFVRLRYMKFLENDKQVV